MTWQVKSGKATPPYDKIEAAISFDGAKVLLELSVENFGIIDHIKWRPAAGFSVLTGETGAGKSLIIDAIETLAGKRVGEEAIRAEADRLRIEGTFVPQGGSALKALLAECGIEDEDAVILSRDIGKDGRNLNRLNGRSVPLRFLREIGKLLIDIHGQSDHLS
ncbi:MAG: AAA family ATPase, partial [Chloroflexota bacterium]|nr:AAA family ATPase [Chloroflexota bacterium]